MHMLVRPPTGMHAFIVLVACPTFKHYRLNINTIYSLARTQPALFCWG